MPFVSLIHLVHGFPLESHKEAASLARRMVAESKFGFLGTQMDRTPFGPYTSLELFSDDCESSGHPLVHLVSWGTHGRNLKSNTSASLFVMQDLSDSGRGIMDHSRFTLFGNLEKGSETELECFLDKHPDVREWQDAHSFQIYRMQLTKINWIGGFGDAHYVGPISVSDYLSLSNVFQVQ
ncbi:pyridoxamine 5'-phosphate oxidase-domain-containing protein [Gorgonomyces haynaldii]|nr:pyridoxamine 5'-phosphate oxidase-domain-containing protein [Gorgonomyces haynaldii]